MNLSVLDGRYCVCKSDPEASIPEGILQSPFYSVSKSPEELSVICHEDFAPKFKEIEPHWVVLKVEGILDFSLTGVLASIANPLAENDISLFAISSFNTDYIMVKEDQLEKAKSTLLSAGFHFI